MKLKLKSKSSTKPQNQIAVLSENVTEDKFERLVETEDQTLSDLFHKSNVIQKNCTDWADVPMAEIELNHKLHLIGRDGENEMGLTPYAFSQLCTKLGIPTQYMKKCIEAGFSPLVMNNVNNWLDNFGHKKLLIRKSGDVVRGILSDKYSVCDTPEILSAIEQSGMLENMDLKGYVINPSRFHARFVGDKMKVVGEDLFAGIQIDSSDVGRSKLDIKFLIYKQVCTNGLILPQSAGSIYEQKHIGISSEKMVETLHDSFKEFSAKVGDATNLIDKARNVEITDTESLYGMIKNGAKVGEDAVEKILTTAIDKYEMTAWGIVNAITEVSQDYTLEHRIGMERYAGVLLAQLIK